jgi:hypothetical protein
MVNKQLAIFINVGLETQAARKLFEQDMLSELQELIKACNSQNE